ncbi:MAG: M56 family metallopeptidase [Acidimicrobiia bacterium]
MTLSALRRARSTWRERRTLSSAQQVVLDSAEPLAYSLPGRDGGILLSRGLRSGLSRPELRVVIEHEVSHLRHRHHRYLLAGTICAAVVPFLRGVDRQIRFAVERWADEDAARAVGDRQLVAATIARVALDGTNSAVLAFSGSGVLERVEAMLDEPPVTSDLTGATLLATTGITASTMTAPALQVHHWIGSLPS